MVAPYAYVVEYRAVDACFPPDCKIDGSATFGRAESEPQGTKGAYVAFGTDKHELFAKRGLILEPAKDFSFTLPAVQGESVFDMSLAAASASGGSFRAVLEVLAGQRAIASYPLQGTTERFEPRTDPAELGRQEKFFSHVRQALPPRTEPLTLVVRNVGDVPLGIGAPVVLRRVEGRGARQAFMVFFDAVPYPLFEQLYRGDAGEGAKWISEWVAQGTFFSQAISPGQLTGSFVRRFFRGDYYSLDGDPSLAGRGFDETPPARAPGPVARLAEQGFVTQAIASNLYLSPVLSRIGFDHDYNIESTLELQIHPPVLARRIADEIDRYSDTDALFVIWYANTHAPWRDVQRDAPPIRTAMPDQDLDKGVLEPVWKNLLEAVDSLHQVVDRAEKQSEGTDRIWILSADHGHTFRLASRARPWRLTDEPVNDGHMHCCLATQQEARTPLMIVGESRAPAAAVHRTIADPVSTLAAWGLIEQRFGVDLDLPKTSAFQLPHAERPAFDDGIFVSMGNSGSLFATHDHFSYHSYQPALQVAAAWELGPKAALLLKGTPEPSGDVVAEELYDLSKDPAETHNVADERFADLLEERRRIANWLAEYVDDPAHERYAYVLSFASATELGISAPRPFFAEADQQGEKGYPGRAQLTATGLRLRDADKPLGVVDVAGAVLEHGLVVRCAANGLPVAKLTAENPRLNLALARTNCVGAPPSGSPQPAPGEALFRAELVSRKEPTGRAALAAPELKSALERWGYVREK